MQEIDFAGFSFTSTDVQNDNISGMACVFIKVQLLFPPEGLVYDYRFDDAGLTLAPLEEDEEEAIRSSKVTTFTFTLTYSMVLVI